MKKYSRFLIIYTLLLFVLVFLPMSSITASADTGPKPSVRVSFENMGDTTCYGTLLSKAESTGPYSVWDGNEAHKNLDYERGEEPIWRAFAEYEDTDGYYFLQTFWKVSETKQISWTYYPPKSFKILLYYPESGQFIVSEIYEKYAFDTYYTVNMQGIEINSVAYDEAQSTNVRIEAYRSYQYKMEALSLLARIIITIIIEMCVALLFGFRRKKQIFLLVGVNGGTQIILNLLLNAIDYFYGAFAFLLYYLLFELIVFVLESILYCLFMNKLDESKHTKKFYIVYALIANAVSFISGFFIANIIPDVF